MAKRTIIGYKTYSFKEKDPAIDALRTIIADEGASYSELHDLSGVAARTMWGWFHGPTKRPQHATIMAVAIALGYNYKLVKVGKVIAFKKKATP